MDSALLRGLRMGDSVVRMITKLRRVIDGEAERGEITYAECVGCLEVVKAEVISMIEEEELEEEEDV